MAAEATFRYGDNLQMMDYTPGADVNAGEVVVVGDVVGIAHLDIASGKLGALAIDGGVYSCAGDAAIAAGKKVWWNTMANQVTETSSGNKFFGTTVTACSGAAALCDVAHLPSATV